MLFGLWVARELGGDGPESGAVVLSRLCSKRCTVLVTLLELASVCDAAASADFPTCRRPRRGG